MADKKVVEEKEETVDTAKTANAGLSADLNKDLSKDAQKVLEIVEKMTVLELSVLVKALEEKFGVSATAPMMMGAMPAGANGASAEPVEEQTEFDVVLAEAGANKINVIKAVRTLDQSLGLVEAKNLVESTPKTLMENADKETAQNAKRVLEAAGAKVELK